jgi:hypothetical protein
MKTLIATLTLGSLMLLGCSGPAASQGGFDSDNPASRLYAIVRAGHQQQRSAIPDLIESLDSDDPAVRMLAIKALDNITGTRMGYNPYGNRIDRRRALDAWLEAWRSGRFE